MAIKLDGTTHAEGCWSWGPKHYECAVAQIERLQGVAADGHTHQCRRCDHPYTPADGDSEDCPKCGFDGVVDV